MTGWISVHRSLFDHWLWEDKPFSKGQAWIDLILMANHEDRKFLHGNNLEFVERGSKITSLRILSDRWGWSTGKVKRFLDLLKQDGMLEYECNTKKTAYTIVNYNIYQNEKVGERNTNRTQTKQLQNTNETSTKTNNNDNNDNNDNNENKVEALSYKYDDIVSSWNDLGLQELRNIKNNRKVLLDTRLKEHGEDSIYEAIRQINKSSFCKGQNQRGWVITFDWLIKPNNYIKVLEGNYTDKNNTSGLNKKMKSKSEGKMCTHKDYPDENVEDIITRELLKDMQNASCSS